MEKEGEHFINGEVLANEAGDVSGAAGGLVLTETYTGIERVGNSPNE